MVTTQSITYSQAKLGLAQKASQNDGRHDCRMTQPLLMHKIKQRRTIWRNNCWESSKINVFQIKDTKWYIQEARSTPSKINTNTSTHAYTHTCMHTNGIEKVQAVSGLGKSRMFLEALGVIAKNWKQLKCPSMGEWINKLWYIHTLRYYLAI